LLVGLESGDDAAVYKVSDELAIIHTIDFFPPIVDDPYAYGAIAAANAMSDVYAMGGEVMLALNVCAFPTTLPSSTIAEILRGGAEKIAEAGGVLAGGHTIDDKEPKYGLSVIGRVRPDAFLTKAGAKDGDVVVLTKPLGVGIITTAAKNDLAQAEHLAAAVESMQRLNREAARLLRQVGVHACTDVTGFSLLGHACQIAENSGVRLRFGLGRLPFVDGAKKYAGDWLFPGGTGKNESYYGNRVDVDAGITDAEKMLLFTPETSGGLLAAVGSDEHAQLISLFQKNREPIWTVGEVVAGEGVEVMP
jgi:selenide,water dikinase